MIKYNSNFFKLLFICIFLLQGCSRILEPVLLNNFTEESTKDTQEEFDINIKPLTFKNAIKANKDIYSRRLMIAGIGGKANVYDEKDFLISKIPEIMNNEDYLFGIGDELSFELLNEFIPKNIEWPTASIAVEYILGVGDELTFAQYSDSEKFSATFDSSGKLLDGKPETDKLISTTGVIGSNGNILLIGVGNIEASNKTLTQLQEEVRNILIRNGFSPNFQLDISNFQSKKAYLTFDGEYMSLATNKQPIQSGKVISIKNIPISLKEVVLSAGLSETDKNLALITLTRDKKEFRVTAGQLFDKKATDVYIQDKDQIDIKKILTFPVKKLTSVGTNGKVLLPGVGSINVLDRSLYDVQAEVSNILEEKGLNSNFQLELIGFKSKKIYFIAKDIGTSVIPLSNNEMTLKELLISKNPYKKIKSNSLSIVKLKRGKKTFLFTLDKILDPNTPEILLNGDDQIEYEILPYKNGQVFVLSGAGNALIFDIDPSKRETLADTLFTKDGALRNLNSKRSEVYLIRGQRNAIAYHLDAQNVSRVLVAAKTELRPNDIIYTADRPIISFSRLLAEITPLRTLLRDIDEGNLP
jgi:protein involved in polysaccharide export with SLBB domain